MDCDRSGVLLKDEIRSDSLWLKDDLESEGIIRESSMSAIILSDFCLNSGFSKEGCFFGFCVFSSNFKAQPRSPTFATDSFHMKIFSDFKSLWIISLE